MERFTVEGELGELEVATMAKTLDLEKCQDPDAEPESNQVFSLLPERAPLFPQYLGGKGYHIATKKEAGCTIKAESTIKVKLVDAVHGRGAVSPKLKKATGQPDGGLAPAEVGGDPR